MAKEWRALVDHWLGTHLGIINLGTLNRLECPPRTLTRMLGRGELVPMLPGVYRSAQWPFGHDQRMAAACARNEHAYIGFTTAGHEWIMRRIRERRLHALIAHGCSPELDGVIVHRCRRIDPVDVVQRPDGIRLTSPPRTLFDMADIIGPQATASILEQMLHEKKFTFATMLDTVERLAHPRRPGSRTMLDVIGSRPAWRAAVHSDLEARVLEQIAASGLPTPVPQCPVTLPTGTTIHLDFGWPQWKVGLEIDHPAWHAGAEDSHRDKHRDRKAATVDWRIARVTDIDVSSGLCEAIADVAGILCLAGWGG